MKYLMVGLFILGPFVFSSLATASSALTFTDARILEPLKATSVSAGFAKVTNNSDTQVRVKVTSAPPFAAVELHESYDDHGKSKMREIDSFVVPPHGTFELKPGEYHLMLFDPTKSPVVGDHVTISFEADGKTLKQSFEVIPRKH